MRIARRNLKKQSQFGNRKNGVMSTMTMVYGDYDGPGRRKNKANFSGRALEFFDFLPEQFAQFLYAGAGYC